MSHGHKILLRLNSLETSKNRKEDQAQTEPSDNGSLNLPSDRGVVDNSLNSSSWSSFAEEALALRLKNPADVSSVGQTPITSFFQEVGEDTHLISLSNIRKTSNEQRSRFHFQNEILTPHILPLDQYFANSNESDVIVDRDPIELVHLDDLFQLLVSAFFGDEPNIDNVMINGPKLEVFESVINTKLKKKGSPHCFKVSEWTSGNQTIHQTFSKFVTKRLEEILKFIMNKFFKHLKKKFSKNNGLLFLDEDKFTQAYFAETAKSKYIPISYFTFPKVVKGQSAYRLDFFKDLFESEKLKEAYNEWTTKHFWADYRKTIRKKILALLSVWDAKLEKHKEDQAPIFKEMVNSFKNIQLRSLPWTKHQIAFAFDRLNTLLFKHK